MVGRDHKIYFYLGRIFEHQLWYEKMYFYKSGAVCGDVSETRKALFKLVNHTIELVFFCYMIPYAFLYLRSAIESGQVSPACGIPMYYIQAAPFVCFILAAFRIVQRWWIELQVVRAKEKGGEESCQS